jgi:ATP-dependent Lon protease
MEESFRYALETNEPIGQQRPEHGESDQSTPVPNPAQNDLPTIPNELSLLPLFNIVAYPQTVVPIAIGQPQSIQLIDDALIGGRMVALVALKADDERPDPVTPDDFYRIGCAANVHRLLKMPDGTLRVAVQGIERIEIEEIVQTEPYFKVRVRAVPDVVETGIEIEALMRTLQGLVAQIAPLVPQFPEDLQTAVLNEDEPRRLAYLLALSMRIDLADRQAILEETSVRRKLEQLVELLQRELQVLQVGQQIQGQVDQELSKTQRDYILRQQLEAIRRELGDDDTNAAEIDRFREAIQNANLPQEARETADRELDRLSRMNPAAPDYSIIRTYLEMMTSLPWNTSSEDQLDVERAREVLDEDHYDLDEIKERILEFLAVRELRRERMSEKDAREGAILCFVGPPGVGKTSLGRSIARAMNREFLRISLGGVRDEAEIRGHRRTYVGALPGTIIQSLRRVGVNNPVFMLDEIDKLGMDFRGDPSSALLEVLDPEQNNAFRDHYLDVAFDLSNVMFIATANSLQPIPDPLRDRMEIIPLSGYTMQQKLEIAKRYLVPEQLRAHALTNDDVQIDQAALQTVIEEYTREAGVRNLEREVGALCRKAATEIVARRKRGANGEVQPIVIDAAKVRQYLGKQRFFAEAVERIDRPGVATGLVWTPVGGDIIFIEATKMPGGKGFMLTGQLGEVMKESARAALSYIRAEADRLGIPGSFFNGYDIHLHVPAGAIPKDGPSAGTAMATALASLVTGRPVRDDVAMTGEITLRGKVLPIGGLKEKVLAAHRAGIKTVILPKRNERDLDDIPPELRDDLRFVLADRVEDVLNAALQPQPSEPPVEAAQPTANVVPVREGMDEGIHIIESPTTVEDQEPVDAPAKG